MRRIHNKAWLLSLALLGCMGEQSQTVRTGDADAPPSEDTSRDVQAELCPSVTVLKQPLRRLNRTELAHSLEALLGSSAGVMDTLPGDDAILFDNDADALTVSPSLVEKLDELFVPLVDKALLPQASGGTGMRERILVCAPAAGGEADCIRQVLATFVRQAWRRPGRPEELERLTALVQTGRNAGETFEASIALGLRGALLSPHFLYRVELDTAQTLFQVDDHALAVRLSYFLWSAPPDAELQAAAEEGRLSSDEEIAAQVQRMLRDPKARALVDNFGAQWLELRGLESAHPSAEHYPAFDEALRSSMREETKHFFASFVTSERSALDMLDADFTYVDARLARHYGLSGVSGTQPQQVTLPAGRAGLLTQASVLINGSSPTRGSPSKRGRFVLERLLCRPPPPPPPNVATEIEAADPTLPMRERLEAHRKNPACAGCHSEMDPIGLTFEHFDGVGGYRETFNGAAIDTSGRLPNGSSFQDPRSLAQVLKGNPEFGHCLAEQLYAYAMGRAPRPQDRCALQRISERFAAHGHRFEELVLSVALSEPFRYRQPQAKGQ